MLDFYRIYWKWLRFSNSGIVLKENTPQHIVDLYEKESAEIEKAKANGIIID